MSYGKFVAILSTRDGSYKRFVARNRYPMQQGSFAVLLVDEERDAELFDTSGDAKLAALAALRERDGKMLSGKFTQYGVRKSWVRAPRRMDGFMDFFKKEGERIMDGGSNGPDKAAQYLEAFKGADFATRDAAIRAAREREDAVQQRKIAEHHDFRPDALLLDWQNAGEELYAAFAVIIDQIDYTNQACRHNEPIGGVLEPALLANAKTALSAWMNLRIKDRSRSGDGVGG